MPWIGSAIQAGGSILGGLMGGSAAGDAASKQSEAIDRAITEQRARYNDTKAMLAPYSGTGLAANARLKSLLGLGGAAPDVLKYGNGVPIDSIDQIVAGYKPEDQAAVRAALGGLGVSSPEGQRIGTWDNNAVNAALSQFTPADSNPDAGFLTRQFNADDLAKDVPYQSGLQFGLDEGRKAVNERAIANGGYDSGATLKALTRFGNDYGSTKAGEAYGRFTGRQGQTYNMLSGQQQMGVNAAGTLAGANQSMGNTVSGLLTDQGNAASAGIVGKANAMAGAFGGVGSAIQGYQNNQILQALMKNRSGGTGYGGGTWGLNGGAFNPDN